MMQIYHITAALGSVDGGAAADALTTQMDKLKGFYPALRGATVTADATVLTMTVRVNGRSRWHCSYAARRIASSMLRRVKLDPVEATMTLQESLPPGMALTKEQGRNVNPRKPKPKVS